MSTQPVPTFTIPNPYNKPFDQLVNEALSDRESGLGATLWVEHEPQTSSELSHFLDEPDEFWLSDFGQVIKSLDEVISNEDYDIEVRRIATVIISIIVHYR